MQKFTDNELKMLDIFVEISTAHNAGQLRRVGQYADRAIDIMRAEVIEERRKLTTEFAASIDREASTEDAKDDHANVPR